MAQSCKTSGSDWGRQMPLLPQACKIPKRPHAWQTQIREDKEINFLELPFASGFSLRNKSLWRPSVVSPEISYFLFIHPSFFYLLLCQIWRSHGQHCGLFFPEFSIPFFFHAYLLCLVLVLFLPHKILEIKLIYKSNAI
mgnify:CR=1 FL=1